MPDFASEITLHQPVEEVFDYLADCRNETRWHPDAVSVELISDGPIGPGTRFAARYRKVGRMDVEIVEYERPRRLAVAYRSRSGPAHGVFSFVPAGEGTTVSVRGGVELKGLWRLFTPLVGASIRREQAKWQGWLERGLGARAR